MCIENLIARVSQMISFGAEIEDIYAMLVAEGCDEGQAYLVYKAAQVMVRGG